MSYNPFSLEGKTILITGASSGIGRTTAIECSKLGAKVVITGRNAERLQETFDLLEGGGHIQNLADLTNVESLEQLVAEMPQIDGLVNNAGIAQTKLISFLKQTDLENIFSVNTYSPVLLTKLLIKNKKINKGGSIVFTSSVAAMASDIGNAVYGMSKSALQAFSRYCAVEFAGKQIRVNSVLPGAVETSMLSDGVLSDEDRQKDMKRYPLGRYGKPKDVAWAIIYLLSDASSWVTGSQLVVDGGLLLN